MTNSNETKQVNVLIDFLGKNAWALAIVASSVIGQWAVFGVRLQTVEERLDRQGTAISTVQSALAETQTQYASLAAKLDAIDSNVSYIRNRLDTR